MTLFLCGDAMTGRGVDQILPHPSGQQIFESYVQDAREYVKLAESRNGPISNPNGSRVIVFAFGSRTDVLRDALGRNGRADRP